jgi:Spx/MgsR family transcriptional regulator
LPKSAKKLARNPAKKKATAGTARSKRRGTVHFLQKPTCTSCRNARSYMEDLGFGLEFRNLDTERLSVAELDALIGTRDHREFLNTRNELYRAKNMKQNPPSRAEALRLMAATPNLIRRPVIIAGDTILLGFNPEAIDEL